jgi:hypothetical protein
MTIKTTLLQSNAWLGQYTRIIFKVFTDGRSVTSIETLESTDLVPSALLILADLTADELRRLSWAAKVAASAIEQSVAKTTSHDKEAGR